MQQIEILPGKYANEGQAAVIQAVQPWLATHYTQLGQADMFRLIEGGAGVGKTTVTNKCLENVRGKIIGATVSDEARGVLQLSMIGKETLTIAKLLGLVGDKSGAKLYFRERNAKEEEKFRNAGKVDPIEEASVVVIDECSMIDKKTWHMIVRLRPDHTKILFLGDRTQIPPIGELISQVFVNLDNNAGRAFKLTEPMRYAEGQPIFQVTETLFAKNVSNHYSTGELISYNPLTAHEIVDHITEREAVLYRANHLELMDDIAVEFKQATHGKDVVVIADTNNTVASVNRKLRTLLFPGADEEAFLIGERIRMTEPYILEKQVAVDNNAKGVIKKKTESNISGVETWKLLIEFDFINRMGELCKKLVSVPVIRPGFEREYDKELEKRRLDAIAGREPWYKFYNWKELFGKMDYAYAMTTHKVQGSTYKNVYILEYEIFRRNNPREAIEINQLMRTATSRASQKMVIVTDKSNNMASTLIKFPELEQVSEPQLNDDEQPELYGEFGVADLNTNDDLPF